MLLVAVLERRHIKYFKSWKDSADNEGLWEHTIITHISKRFQRFSARAEVEAVFDSVEDIPIESRSGSPAGKKTGSHRGHKKPAPHTSQHPHSFPHAPRKRRESELASVETCCLLQLLTSITVHFSSQRTRHLQQCGISLNRIPWLNSETG